jgi:alcohol dehydrogenase class IV
VIQPGRSARPFRHRFLPQTVAFVTGDSTTAMPIELDRLDITRPMVISTPSAHLVARRIFEGLQVGLWWDEVVQHVPADLVESATEAARRASVDGLVTIGGGSATGLGKALTKELERPLVAVPTTYSGSESTNVFGVTSHGAKVTAVDDRALPDVVLYDADLTATMPRELAVASGINALAHSVEGFWAPGADPINDALAQESISLLVTGLHETAGDSDGRLGQERCLLGAYLSGLVLASAGSGLHHTICHVLGGTFRMPHALTHAAVLPHVVAFNAPPGSAAAERLTAAFGGNDPTEVLAGIAEPLGGSVALAEHGLTEDHVEHAVEMLLTTSLEDNPRPVSREDLVRIIEGARTGSRPGVLRADPD